MKASIPACLIGLLAGAMVAGCSDHSPAAPTSTAPSIGSVTLLPGTDWLTLGSSVSLTAFVTMTNGTGQPMEATWRSSNTAVAEVSDRGVVLAVGAGRASITATTGGVAATRAIRVAPDFTATWSGRAIVNGCVDLVGVSCSVQPGEGSSLGAVLAQVGERVSGVMQVRAIAVPVSGALAEDGMLVLEGVLEDRSGERVDNRRRWRELRLTADQAGARFTGRGILESEYLNADQSVRARSLVDYAVTAERTSSLPTPTAR